MTRRRLGLGAAAIALTVPLSGCVTVHGERALIPSTSKAEAARVLARFAVRNNMATRSYDEHAISASEAGPLGATDSAGVRARHANSPQGNPSYTPLEFSDPTYVIPKQVGWPKFFVAETRTNRDQDGYWLLAFRRAGPTQPWKADYLGVVAAADRPEFALDDDGYAREPNGEQLYDASRLSGLYAKYLDADEKDFTASRDGAGAGQGTSGAVSGGGTAAPGATATASGPALSAISGMPEVPGSQVFADGPYTSQLRSVRAAAAHTADTVTQYADQADTSGDFAPVALRLADGGALVFFSTRHQSRATFRAGTALTIDKNTKALMTGTPKTSVTQSRVSQNMVIAPERGPGNPISGGRLPTVRFVSSLVGLVSARGE